MKKDKKWNQLTYKNILWIITYTILLILALLYIKSIISGVKMKDILWKKPLVLLIVL